MNAIRLTGVCLVTMFYMFVPRLVAQNDEGQKQLPIRAYNLYLDQEYHHAARIYAQLLSFHTDDEAYNYYYGVCVIESSNDRKIAIPHLEKAATGKKTEARVHYYLARAYQQERLFEQAIAQYELAVRKEKRHFVEEHKIEAQIQACLRALDMNFQDGDKTITSRDEVKAAEFFLAVPFMTARGHFLSIPDRLVARNKKSQYGSMIFVDPDGKWMVYSGPGKKGGSEIYLSHRKSHDSWHRPEVIGYKANLQMNKYYPTVTDNGKTIYFSSDEHNSLGGLDLYVTSYDATEKVWSIPSRLPPPFNSPSDDYYFLPLQATGSSVFCSDRKSIAGEIGVYTAKASPAGSESMQVVLTTEDPAVSDTATPHVSVPVVSAIEPIATVTAVTPAEDRPAAAKTGSEPGLSDATWLIEPALEEARNREALPGENVHGDKTQETIHAVPRSAKPAATHSQAENGTGDAIPAFANATGAIVSPVSVEGFYYNTKEPRSSNVNIVVEREGEVVARCHTQPHPAAGDYRFEVPGPGTYQLKITSDSGHEFAGNLHIGTDEIQACRQIITGGDSLKQPFLTVLDCGESITRGQNDVTYAVQIGAFRETDAGMVMANFSKLGITQVTAMAKNEFTAFVTAGCPDFYSALLKRKDLMKKGIPDAFIIALKDNAFTPLAKAVLTVSR